MSNHKPSVIIVGAGPGGLATAICLARDFQVTVVEKNAWPGGRMGRIEQDGYAFDTGPSILQYPRALRDVFDTAGARLDDYVELLRVEPYTYLKFWDGSELYSSTDEPTMMARLEQLKPGLGARFARWSGEHRIKNEVAYKAFIASPADSILAYFNPLKTAPAARFKPWQTLYDCLDDYFDDDRITYALSYPAKYLGLHPTNCSSVFSVISYLEYAFGVWHPRGGFRALADGMQRCAEDLGVTFEFEVPVKRIMTTPGEGDANPRVTGVERADGQVMRADYVVCNADFAYANQTLLPASARRKYTDEKLHRMKYSCSTFMLYLGLDKRYDLPHHSIYLSEHVRRTEPEFLQDAQLDLDDPPFYVCNPCATETSSAPEGHSTLYVLVPCPNAFHEVDWANKKQVMRDRAVERLALLGFEDVADHIVHETCYTTQTWQDQFNVFKGAVFNLAHTWTQIGPLRPRCDSEDVEGLFWVGGGTHPGSGLLTIFESARIAARAMKKQAAPTPGSVGRRATERLGAALRRLI